MTDYDAGEMINQLLNGELHAAHLYWQAAGWSADRHLDGCVEFFKMHADEELMHMRKMLDFMIDSDLTVTFSALPAPTINAPDILGVFRMIYDHEEGVTANIGRAASSASAASDHSTFEFLQWFVMEQREELSLFREIVDRIQLIGDGPHALYFTDQEVSKISARIAAAAAAQAAAGPP